MKKASAVLARFIERHPWWSVIATVLLTAAMVPGITMLEIETGTNVLVSPNSEISLDSTRYEEQFGGEAIVVLLEGDLEDIFSVESINTLTEFRNQAAGNPRISTVTGPLDLLELAVAESRHAGEILQAQIELTQEAAAAEAIRIAAEMGLDESAQELAALQAVEEVLAGFQQQIEQLQLIGEPALDNPLFISAVLYDPEGGINTQMLPFIPDDTHVLISVTPRGNMDDEDTLGITQDIEEFFTENPLTGVNVSVVAITKLLFGIGDSISRNMTILLGLSVAAMVLILFLIFRVRWRLLSLLVVGMSTAWTFGLMGYISVPITMGTMSALPVLIGLGIDYSIQFHNRYQEEITRSSSVGEAVITAAFRMLPTVGIALLATIIGFITLYISKVPMIRDFGMMLAIGAFLSFLGGFFLVYSVVYLTDRNKPLELLQEKAAQASGRIERVLRRMAELAVKYTLPIFLISVVFGVAGGVVDHLLPTNTDIQELIPQDIAELQEIRSLRELTSSGGQIQLMIEADDVASPALLEWLTDYQDRMIELHPEVISVNSPAVLVTKASGGVIPAGEQIEEILESTPEIYLKQLISDDRTTASVSFDISHISFEEIHTLLQDMVDGARPPDGVEVSAVGSLALGASIIDALVGTRFIMNIICLCAMFIVLLMVYRRIGMTALTIIPVGAVIAWSSLDMYLIGIPLNPLTSILGVLIIGICTEFMVLLIGRYEEEKQQGLSPGDAMITATSKIGRAIVSTALTTLGGFGVLMASNFVMIRDFGIATVLGVFLCLVITITVMPGLIVWFDRLKAKRSSR